MAVEDKTLNDSFLELDKLLREGSDLTIKRALIEIGIMYQHGFRNLYELYDAYRKWQEAKA